MADNSTPASTPCVPSVTLSDIERIIDKQTRAIEEKLGPVREDLSNVLSSIQAIGLDIADLKQRTLSLEQTCSQLAEKQEDVAETVDDLQEDVQDLQKRYEEELDKLEAFSRRDNLRFFGIMETPGETFDSCATKVVECLQNTVPNKTWTEDDIVRAHRVGKKLNFASVAAGNQSSKPRPMIVKFARWKDKMDVLTKGRQALKQKGMNVAGDLTNRQHEQIRQQREKGMRAYYKGNQLIIAGPIDGEVDNPGRRQGGNNGNRSSVTVDRRSNEAHRGNQGHRATGQQVNVTRARAGTQSASPTLPSPKPPKRRRPPSSPTVQVNDTSDM